MQWTGVAILMLGSDHPSRADGYIGAFAAIACENNDIVEAIGRLSRELYNNKLILVGLESFISIEMLDRNLTIEEENLISKLENYPVQFDNVHLHRGDA